MTTNEKGQLRFPALPSGSYALDIEAQGFATYHESDISIGAGATIERTAVLNVASVAESVVVEGRGSSLEARGSGFGTRFGPDTIKAIPTRRSSMFDFIGAAPGISATSPGTGGNSLVSAFGSGANENTFLIDGTNFTSPANGVARAEPGVDFIQEIHVQSIGASAEFGNVQGAVVDVITRQGSNRLLYDASYYGQPAGLTSQPVRLVIPGAGDRVSGYERARYRDSRRTSVDQSFGIDCGSSPDTSICATTTVNQAPTRISRGSTSRTRSSRSSRGDWLRRGSWFRAFTTSTGSTPRSRRR